MPSLDLGVLKISIGVDNKEANKQIQGTKKEMDGASGSAKNFLQKFGSGFSKTMKVAGAAVGAVSAGAVALAKGIYDSAVETANYCDVIDKASQRMGISAEYYQKLDYAVGQCGVSMETMEKASLQLQKAGSELTFEEAINSIMACEDATEQARMAQELFGDKVAHEITPLLNTGAEGFEELLAQAEEYGLVIGDDAVAAGAAFGDSLALMQQTLEALKNNLMSEFFPALTDITSGIAGMAAGIDGAEEQFSEGLSGFITSISKIAQKILQMAPTLLQSLIDGISQNLPSLVTVAMDILLQLVNTIIANLPMIVETALQILLSVVQGITQALPELIPVIIEVLLTVVNTIIENLPLILDAGLQLLLALVDGIINEGLPVLIEQLPNIINSIINFLTSPDTLMMLIQSAIQLMLALVKGIITSIPQILSAIGQILLNIVKNIMQFLPQLKEKGKELIVKLGEGIISNVSQIKEKIGELWAKMKEKFSESFKGIMSVGKDLITGLWNGINDKVNWIKEKVLGFGQSVLNTIKGIFGIHSPSREFAKVGDFLVQGLGQGIKDNTYKALKEVANMSDAIENAFNPSLNADSIFNGYSTKDRYQGTVSGRNASGGNKNITQNNYFTAKETTPYEQQVQIKRLNRELLGVYA